MSTGKTGAFLLFSIDSTIDVEFIIKYSKKRTELCYMEKNPTAGSAYKNKIAFSLLYLLSYFLQALYGLADLFIIGRYEDDASTTAVSIGSQVMHMLTVMTAGLVMGATAGIGRAVGGGFPGKSRNRPFEGTLAVGEIFPMRPYLFGAG